MLNQNDRMELEKLDVLFGGMTQYITAVGYIIITVLDAISLSIAMVVRKDFGIRFITPIKFGASWIFNSLFLLLLMLMLDAGFLFYLFYSLIWVMFIAHYVSSNRKFWKKGITWLTYSSGVSRFEWVVYRARQWNIPILKHWTEWTLYRWIDPLYAGVLGFFMIPLDQALGVYFLVCSVALFFKNQMEYGQALNEYLDWLDAQLMALMRQESMNGKPKSETKGFTAYAPPAPDHFDIDLTGSSVTSRDAGSNGKPDFSGTLEETLSEAPGQGNPALNLRPIRGS